MWRSCQLEPAYSSVYSALIFLSYISFRIILKSLDITMKLVERKQIARKALQGLTKLWSTFRIHLFPWIEKRSEEINGSDKRINGPLRDWKLENENTFIEWKEDQFFICIRNRISILYENSDCMPSSHFMSKGNSSPTFFRYGRIGCVRLSCIWSLSKQIKLRSHAIDVQSWKETLNNIISYKNNI